MVPWLLRLWEHGPTLAPGADRIRRTPPGPIVPQPENKTMVSGKLDGIDSVDGAAKVCRQVRQPSPDGYVA